jgi:hypothetical protein
MKESDFKQLSEYVSEWRTKDLKPCNEKVFINEFIKLIDNYPDEREVTFDGDGSYFGKQVTLEPFSFYGRSDRNLAYEVAYSNSTIRVYNADHHGFWNPEFISMDSSHEDFTRLKDSLYKFLTTVFGL